MECARAVVQGTCCGATGWVWLLHDAEAWGSIPGKLWGAPMLPVTSMVKKRARLRHAAVGDTVAMSDVRRPSIQRSAPPPSPTHVKRSSL
jgi:hypothetical protein